MYETTTHSRQQSNLFVTNFIQSVYACMHAYTHIYMCGIHVQVTGMYATMQACIHRESLDTHILNQRLEFCLLGFCPATNKHLWFCLLKFCPLGFCPCTPLPITYTNKVQNSGFTDTLPVYQGESCIQ